MKNFITTLVSFAIFSSPVVSVAAEQNVATDEQTVIVEENVETTEQEPKKGSSFIKTGLKVTAIVATALVGYGVYGYFKTDEKKRLELADEAYSNAFSGWSDYIKNFGQDWKRPNFAKVKFADVKKWVKGLRIENVPGARVLYNAGFAAGPQLDRARFKAYDLGQERGFFKQATKEIKVITTTIQ